MKKYIVFVLAGIFWFHIGLLAQPQEETGYSTIQPQRLLLGFNKTSCLIFSYPVKMVDRGSRDVIARIVSNADTVLLIKANKENFKETNLSVITADGILYSFILNYSENPRELTHFYKKGPESPQISNSATHRKTNEEDFRRNSSVVLKNGRTLRGVSENKYEMKFRLKGLYIKQDALYCHLEIQNNSNFNYNTDFIRLYIRDRIKAKRTVSQEIELKPLFVLGNYGKIGEESDSEFVYVIPALTLPDQKYLIIEIAERNGGRHFMLKVSNRKILRAKLLPD